MKPRVTPPNEWYKAEHPKFLVMPPPLSRSQKRRFQRFRQAPRRAKKKSDMLEDMKKEVWGDTAMEKSLDQEDMDINDLDEAIDFRTKRTKKFSKTSMSKVPQVLQDIPSNDGENPRSGREHKPKERIMEEAAP